MSDEMNGPVGVPVEGVAGVVDAPAAEAGCGPARASVKDTGCGTPDTASAGRPDAISVSELAFAYPGCGPVLRGASFSVPEGAFALLVGDTGSGKSTLLSLLKPEVAPAGERSGGIRVFGEDLEHLPACDSARRIGFVFQNPDSQIVCDSVWHEMAFGLENLGTPQSEMRRRIAETCYFFGMDDWFRASTDALSGGRKQLLSLASVLVMRPKILLLDEPTAQLDPIAEKNFLHALFRVNRELGCTIVVATHAPRAMVDYATCAFKLAEGEVKPIADMERLRERPLLVDCPLPPGSPGCDSDSADGRAEQGSDPDRSMGCGRGGAPALDVRSVWFRYDREGAWVLRGLDFVPCSGEIHALVGGNGCGKSTLLGLMAGTLKPRRGSVRLTGATSGVRALLPQDPRALFVCETVAEEIAEWAAEDEGSRAPSAGPDSFRTPSALLRTLNLEDRSRAHPYDLSGGQQQLLALGKIVAARPGILLLDEPTKGLDVDSRRLVARLLRLLADAGDCVVMATHDLDFASQVADRVSMVFDGQIASTEPAGEFFSGNSYYRP